MSNGGSRPAVFLWSGGKDSAAALAAVREADRYEILSLVTTVNEEYESRMLEALAAHHARGARFAIAGDIFLGDVRAYRESLFARARLGGVFPLWGRDTSDLARSAIDAGFRAVTTCCDGRVLDKGFAGRGLDLAFLASLPAGADPCGENGEFQTYVSDGPGFGHRIPFELGEVVLRDERFYYADLIPVAPTDSERDGHEL